MEDAQALSGVEEKTKESKYNVGSGKRHCSTQHPTLQALGGAAAMSVKTLGPSGCKYHILELA